MKENEAITADAAIWAGAIAREMKAYAEVAAEYRQKYTTQAEKALHLGNRRAVEACAIAAQAQSEVLQIYQGAYDGIMAMLAERKSE